MPNSRRNHGRCVAARTIGVMPYSLANAAAVLATSGSLESHGRTSHLLRQRQRVGDPPLGPRIDAMQLFVGGLNYIDGVPGSAEAVGEARPPCEATVRQWGLPELRQTITRPNRRSARRHPARAAAGRAGGRSLREPALASPPPPPPPPVRLALCKEIRQGRINPLFRINFALLQAVPAGLQPRRRRSPTGRPSPGCNRGCVP